MSARGEKRSAINVCAGCGENYNCFAADKIKKQIMQPFQHLQFCFDQEQINFEIIFRKKLMNLVELI